MSRLQKLCFAFKLPLVKKSYGPTVTAKEFYVNYDTHTHTTTVTLNECMRVKKQKCEKRGKKFPK